MPQLRRPRRARVDVTQLDGQDTASGAPPRATEVRNGLPIRWYVYRGDVHDAGPPRQPRPPDTGHCADCGKPIGKGRGGRRYCDRACAERARRRRLAAGR